ncbi:Putative odorant receptor 13a [Trachymyrmex zeteki]|uniref:Putative odorant receptor 13a n=1 Tax=Mycetomoellerius zeteki TaxID=64791 RepID=A0A151X284_9HYME|nr:Putative odorant receptor 13a [Trachymyrmex zeteki]
MNVLRAWGNLSGVLENFVSATFSLMGVCKLIVTWYHGEKALRPLMASIMTDWMTSTSDWERNTMLKISRRGRSLSFRCCLSAAGLTTFYLSLYLLRFFKNINQPQRNLVYRLENLQRSPFYEITYFIQLSGGTYSVLANYTIDSFVSILVLQVCAQLINLRTTLNNLVNELVSKSISSSRFREGLAAIVVRHDHLIRNAKIIDGCYSPVLFVHVLAATFQICFITFQVFTVNNMKVPVIKMTFLSFYFVVLLTNMYAYCYSAERLMTESTKMTYGVYECKWYDIPPKHAKDLMFIVYRSRIPLRLTIGKFGIFSLEMFGIILKTSMGYLSALLTIKD